MSAGSATTLREATGKSCCANAQHDQRGLQIEDVGSRRRRRLRNGQKANLAGGGEGGSDGIEQNRGRIWLALPAPHDPRGSRAHDR